MECRNYTKEERFDAGSVEALKHHYAEILRLLGEDPGIRNRHLCRNGFKSNGSGGK